MEHSGGCHCGNLRLRVRLSAAPPDQPLRSCACSFCRAHGTRTVADPAGLAEVWADDWSLVEPYRFGSATADYLICRRCGVYVAALCETASGLRAVVNVNSLDDRAAFDRAPSLPDYDGETAEARLARRARNWMPAQRHR
ncbi:MAG: GFA family protein [Stellaceae bacterium]